MYEKLVNFKDMRFYGSFVILVAFLQLIALPPAWGQADESDTEIEQMEAELEKSLARPEAPPPAAPKVETVQVESVTDLAKLAPFSEISILQRRFLPKTGRFQLFGGLNYLANDPWYWGLGLTAKAGYSFTEAWAIEFNYSGFNNSEKQAIKDLRNNHAVTTDSIVTTKTYMGGDVVWSPIYGKLSLDNKRIVPFDMYFAAGGGMSGLSNNTNASTLHLGLGQIFALSKSRGFRWDLSWSRFTATTTDSTTGAVSNNTFDNLFLTMGMSFFFPEANYR